MVGSIDYLDFCTEPTPEKITIPLLCWQAISLSDIWIPSNLLTNRNKGCNTVSTQGVYHTLQKNDVSKYSESFSVYTDSSIKDEQEDIFLSDSEEDICNSAPVELEETKSLSDSLPLDTDSEPRHFPKLFDNSNKKYSEHVTSKAPSRRNDVNKQSNLKTSDENLYNYDEQKNAKVLSHEKNLEKSYRTLSEKDNLFIPNVEKIDFNTSHSSSSSKGKISEQFKDLKNKQTQEKSNKDSDSHVSLNEIVNYAQVASLKDFVCNFEYKKKDSNSSSLCDKQKSRSKKSKKEKKGKKVEKCIPLESLFEDMNATQEFNCNRYMNNIIKEKERYARIGDNPLISQEEYPNLTPEELVFIHSDNTVKKENVEFTPSFSFVHSDKVTSNLSVSECKNVLNSPVPNDEESSEFPCGKLVIDNIPLDTTKEDISSILCGYGEIRNFSMISIGKCLKVFVEIDLICDIDWVIECLNGTEPFGTSTGVLQCYQQI